MFHEIDDCMEYDGRIYKINDLKCLVNEIRSFVELSEHPRKVEFCRKTLMKRYRILRG